MTEKEIVESLKFKTKPGRPGSRILVGTLEVTAWVEIDEKELAAGPAEERGILAHAQKCIAGMVMRQLYEDRIREMDAALLQLLMCDPLDLATQATARAAILSAARRQPFKVNWGMG